MTTRRRPEITADAVGEADRKLFEALQEKRAKVANMESEISRIRAKDLDQAGLTEGQERQIKANEDRIAVINEQIAELEETLHASNVARAGGGDEGGDLLTDSDGSDEFFDRTAANERKRK
jgi:hypothetical protein